MPLRSQTTQLSTFIGAIEPRFGFALAAPHPSLLPRDAISAAATDLLSSPRSALQFGAVAPGLQQSIADLIADRGVQVEPSQIIVTSGAQQGLHLLSLLLLPTTNGSVIVEPHIYPGIGQTIGLFNSSVLLVGSDGNGLQVDDLERLLAKNERPAFVYVIPDGHNPYGTSMSAERREHLAWLLARYNLHLVEDAANAWLDLDGQSPRAVASYAPNHTFHVGSFSKTVAPALRVGWIAAPEQHVTKLRALKDAADLNVATFPQHIVTHLFNTGQFSKHLKCLIGHYRFRRAETAHVLSTHGGNLRWVEPSCGTSFWLRLPAEVPYASLVEAFHLRSVSAAPSTAFTEHRGQPSSMCDAVRISFAAVADGDLTPGLTQLLDTLASVVV